MLAPFSKYYVVFQGIMILLLQITQNVTKCFIPPECVPINMEADLYVMQPPFSTNCVRLWITHLLPEVLFIDN